MSADLEDLILRTVERWAASRYSERHGLVTSYDPKHYLAKVTFQPDGQESGWLPIETGHIGQGYGIAIGLQPGSGGQQQGGSSSGSASGGSQQQNSGDQVVVRFQEGDFESGKIVQRVHSDQDTPPTVQSGELVIWTKFKQDSSPGPDAAQTGQQNSTGQQIYFKNDGSISIADGNGATIVFDGKGNATLTTNKLTVNAAKDITVTGKQKLTVNASQDITVNGSGNVTVTASSALNLNGAPVMVNGGGSVIPPFTVE